MTPKNGKVQSLKGHRENGLRDINLEKEVLSSIVIGSNASSLIYIIYHILLLKGGKKESIFDLILYWGMVLCWDSSFFIFSVFNMPFLTGDCRFVA